MSAVPAEARGPTTSPNASFVHTVTASSEDYKLTWKPDLAGTMLLFIHWLFIYLYKYWRYISGQKTCGLSFFSVCLEVIRHRGENDRMKQNHKEGKTSTVTSLTGTLDTQENKKQKHSGSVHFLLFYFKWSHGVFCITAHILSVVFNKALLLSSLSIKMISDKLINLPLVLFLCCYKATYIIYMSKLKT